MEEEQNTTPVISEQEDTETTQRQKPIADVISYEVNYVYIFGVVAALLLLAGLIYALSTRAEAVGVPQAAMVVEAIPEERKVPIPFVDPFNSVSIEASAAYVYDIQKDRVLYEKNEEVQLPLASITKLMTADVATDYIDPDESIVIEYENLNEEGDSGLLANEIWRASDLIDFTLIVSSNDGADALASVAGGVKLVRDNTDTTDARTAFINEMNTRAREIGLEQTYFINETGLDPTVVTSGGYGSARDVALLMAHLVNTKPDLIDATTKYSEEFVSDSQFIHMATNTNNAIPNIPGLMGSKTGFTDLAGGNLVIAFDAGINRPVVVAVLGSSKEGRFTDVETLVNAALAHIKTYQE